MILAARSMVVRVELGIQQSRHSTLNSYLEKLLYLVTGNFGRRGTNGIHTWLLAALSRLAGRALERDGPGDHRRPPADEPLRRRGPDRRPAARARPLGRIQQPGEHDRRYRPLRGRGSRARALGRRRRRLHRDGGARRLRPAGRGAVREVGDDALQLRVAAELLPPARAALRTASGDAPGARDLRPLLRRHGRPARRRRARRAARAGGGRTAA